MSRSATPEATNRENVPEQRMHIASNRDGPQTRPEQGRPSQGQANFSDSSGPLFHMYIKMTEEEDEKMTHRWQKDADGILIFTGLFSAALAALLTVSVQDLKPNSQDTSAFYLGNIYQLLADPNISRASILATPVQPPPFSPSNSAVLVNSFWFLSLVISLTSALLATMLQQWARRYLTITQPSRYSPHKRASIRAFFANGVEKFHLPWSVEALPALLHLSLFLFFSGLVIYLFNINHTVFSVVFWWVGLAGGVYGCITWMPIFWHDSPYYSPLSSSAWLIFNFTYSAIRRIRHFLLAHQWPHLEGSLIYESLTKIVQEAGSKLSAEIINRILTWTIDALEEDKELERFFEAIPSFCSSDVVCNRDLECVFTKLDKPLAEAFYGFIRRTLSSSSVLEEDKKRRVVNCVKAADAAQDPAQLLFVTIFVLNGIFTHGEDMLLSVDIARSLRSRNPGLCAQGIIAVVIASVPERDRDERWIALVKDQLGVSEEMLRGHPAQVDNILLINFIHIVRPLFHLYRLLEVRVNEDPCLHPENLDLLFFFERRRYQKLFEQLASILSRLSTFSIRNTLPDLQQTFCALWNEITREAHDRGSQHIPHYILRHIRHLYISLHQGTGSAMTASSASTVDYPLLHDPLSFPLCNIPGHQLISATGETSHPLTITPDPPYALLKPVTPSTELAVSSFPAWTENDSRVDFVGESSLRDVLDATPTIAKSSRHSPPVNVESSHRAAASLDLIAPGLTDKAPATSPTSNSEKEPHPAAVSISIPHPSFSIPSTNSNIPDPQTDAGIGVVLDIPLSSSSGPVANISPPPLPSTFATSIPLSPPSGSHSGTSPNDGPFDEHCGHSLRAPEVSTNAGARE